MKIRLNLSYINGHGRIKRNNKRALVEYGEKGVLTIEEWIAICDAQCWACANCKTIKPLCIDHIRPMAAGGVNTKDNIQALCWSCNADKGATSDANKTHWYRGTIRKCSYKGCSRTVTGSARRRYCSKHIIWRVRELTERYPRT